MEVAEEEAEVAVLAAAAVSAAAATLAAAAAAAASPLGSSSLTAEDGILLHSKPWTDTHLTSGRAPSCGQPAQDTGVNRQASSLCCEDSDVTKC